MFAFKAQKEIAIRGLLIAVIIFNTWTPNAVRALSSASIDGANSASVSIAKQGRKGLAIKSLNYVRAALQESTPTGLPTETETLTPTPSPILVGTPTATAMPSPTGTMSQAPSDTPTQVSTGSSDLAVEFSATPNQAKVGDQITFNLKIVNNGQTPFTGLHFSNILPEGFNPIPSNIKGLAFDAQTRELSWTAGKETAILVGESILLEYTVIVDSPVTDSQIVDTASLGADELKEPIHVEAFVTLSGLDAFLTSLDPKGGEALGLDGQIKISLPKDGLESSAVVSIRDLKQTSPPATDSEPWLVFELGLRVPQLQNAQLLSPGTAAGAGSLLENDRVIPLESIEAKFDEAVELSVSFDRLTDLATLGADQAPFLVTLDEASGTWVRMPLKSIDRKANTITAELTHFSTWGVGFGPSFPTNGAGVLLFDSAYPSLFTGSSKYSIPIWTPPGRNGMQPNLTLSYSSGSVNGVLGDVQAPWVGMGWSIDTAEIARKITTTSAGYGYENKFLLLINGTGYELIPNPNTPDRYHTEAESFLYIQRHNDVLGSPSTPSTANATGEWWEVVEKDGARWRLGYTTGSEQLAAMSGYPGTNPPTGAWATLGYAGNEPNVVTVRWRADQVTDVYDNRMTFTYTEESRTAAGVTYDRASYLSTISYTEHTSGTPAAGYSVVFVLVDRGGNDVPATPTNWDNWDTKWLDRIDIKYGTSTVHTYDLGYTVRPYTDGVSWQTTTLTSVAITGSTTIAPIVNTTAPTITFTYIDQINRATFGTWNEWPYPRLATISNGWGGISTNVYEHDGRPYTSWYNWRVKEFWITDGVNSPLYGPMKSTFAYSTPCYDDPTAGLCNAGNVGSLLGYGQTTVNALNYAGAIREKTVHKFWTTYEELPGREYETLFQDALGTTLRKIYTVYSVGWASGYPTEDSYFASPATIDEFVYNTTTGLLDQISHTVTSYDSYTGNLWQVSEYDGANNLYRKTNYEYRTTIAPSVWILDTVSRRTIKNASDVILSEQSYGYNGNLPGTGYPTTNKPDLSRVVNGMQTIDTKYVYDSYGNVIETRQYEAYGTTGSPLAGTYLTYSTSYDSLNTYVLSTDPPLLPATTFTYDYGLGLPLTVTDPNSSTTTTSYDGLGRVTSVKYHGYAQANIKYTYPTLPVSMPFKLTMEVWDETISNYRSAWQIMDGLGRVVQTQSPSETSGTWILTDTFWDAVGLYKSGGLPRTWTGAGGTYSAPNWASVPYTQTYYDALRRTVSVLYPDASSETFTYSGLRTTSIDRNNHQKVQQVDDFGRLIKVEEYTGSNPYTLYATTNYTYDERDLLKTVTDTAGNQTIMTYDGFGRKTDMTDPDMGNWLYRYNPLGTLSAQIDAKRQAINMYYDDLNRLIGKTYTTGPVNPSTYQPPVDPGYNGYTVKNYYDAGTNGYGHRTSMTDPSGSTTWAYNVLGQVTNVTQNIDSANYTMTGSYDAFGRPLTQTLPSTEQLNYSYNAMGALVSLSGTNTYISQIHYAASGQVTDQLLGNGLLQQACYETNTLRLSKIRVYTGTLIDCGTTPTSPRLNLSYAYQFNGNVNQVVDATRNETLTYTYDDLDRLTNVSGPYNYTYAYDAIGNITRGGATIVPSAVGVGYNHTCAATTTGGDLCWGRNNVAQLGDGTYTQRALPAFVSGLTSGVSATAVGDLHTCALTTGGGVKCWGDNYEGEVGDGTTTERPTPVDVSGLTSGVIALAAGEYHTCALTISGGVKCWGQNSNSQLGDNSTTDRHTPVDVNGLTSGVTMIATGGYHSCALTTSGGVKCWGDNGYGQLGDGTWTQRNTPVDVSGLTSGVLAITAGQWHTCALLTGGGVKCWGRNNKGQLGDGTTSNRITPTAVSGLASGISAITAGGFHTCALTTSGGVKCWGFNTDGEVGDGTTTQRTTPVDVSGLTGGVASIDSSYYHTCAVTTANTLKCWGKNNYKQLSDPTLAYSASPLTVAFPTVYTYGNSAHKHAVTALNSGETYTYDANGNMIQRVEGGLTYTQTFNIENQLASATVSGQTTQFIYDGDGNMVKKIKPNGSKTIYVGGLYEVDKTSGGTVTRTLTYYPAGGAMRINIVGGSNTLYYILKDHLGSASVVTDSSGNIVGEDRFYPYGETRFTTGSIYTDKLYTGQRDVGLGIYHYGARFYSPKLGRFLSPDTIIPGAANPQAFNRYSYANNSPIMYIDPTGHTSACAGANVDPECNGGVDNWAPPSGVTYWRVNIKLRFGITLSNDGDKDWDEGNAKFVYDSLGNIETVVGSNLKSDVAGATFMLSEHHPDADHPNSTYHGWTDGTNVTFYTTGSQVIRQMNLYHEFGHVLNSLPGRDNIFSNQLAGLDHPSFITGGYVNRSALTNPADVFVQASSNAVTEQWADVFANYIAGNINTTSPFGPGMEMYNFVHDVLTVQLGP